MSSVVSLPRLRRAEDDRVVAGVCSGIAADLGVDATVVRLAFALLALASGSGIAAYLGLWALLRLPLQGDRGAPPPVGQDRRDTRVSRPAEAPALEPPRAHGWAARRRLI